MVGLHVRLRFEPIHWRIVRQVTALAHETEFCTWESCRTWLYGMTVRKARRRELLGPGFPGRLLTKNQFEMARMAESGQAW